MEIIKILVYVLGLAFGWRVWEKVVDRADKFIQKKLSYKSYNCLINTLFIIIFVAIIFSIIR